MRKYAKNVYSQNGEDGILEEILKRLGIERGCACEFGAADGKFMSNTFHLLEQGWYGMYIEPDKELYEKLLENVKNYTVMCYNRKVTDDLDVFLNFGIYKKDGIKLPYDVLSIDVDGEDYHIWNKSNKKPPVVIIEVNSSIPPPQEQIHGEGKQGTSFTSMLKLGNEKGYDLVCHTGNMIFVRHDLIGDKFNDVEINSDSLFESKFVGH